MKLKRLTRNNRYPGWNSGKSYILLYKLKWQGMTQEEKKELVASISKQISVDLSKDDLFIEAVAPRVEQLVEDKMDTQIKDAVAQHLAKTGFDVAGLRFNWSTVVSLVGSVFVAGMLWAGLKHELQKTQTEIVQARKNAGLNKRDIRTLDNSINRLETTIAVLVDREDRGIQMLKHPRSIAPQDNTGRHNR